MKRPVVLLLGASGSMGGAALKELWNRRDKSGRRKYDLVLLQRPSAANKALFAPYEAECGIKGIPGRGVVSGGGLKIVWGDATVYEDIAEAVEAVDWVLCPMAFISPEADRHPEMARAVNTTAIEYLVKAIEEQHGGADRIRLVYVGSVAQTGDRPPPIHWGRVGDPLKPSIHDHYATTKIAGERAVLESNLRHWVSLRQTFIMIPDIFSLQDPIMFHQPIDSFMECNTAADAGRGLVNCLDIPADSPFWRRVYNMGGGPRNRISYIDFLMAVMKLMGMDARRTCERRWFALRNFHMHYFLDSAELDRYIHNYGETLEDFLQEVQKNLPASLRVLAAINRYFPPFRRLAERITYRRFKKVALQEEGTMNWYRKQREEMISAFYGSCEELETIPDWYTDVPAGTFGRPEPAWKKLDHGYDEGKQKLERSDLQGAAKFRGGECLADRWDGDLYLPLSWRCARGHVFTARPYTVLKAGHWCPQCLPPPWNYDEEARINPFFAQVWDSGGGGKGNSDGDGTRG